MLLLMRHAVLTAFAAILAASPVLFAQEQPSLGEIARKYREEKRLREAAASAPAVTQQPAAMNINASAVIQPTVETRSTIVAAVPAEHQFTSDMTSDTATHQALTVPVAPSPVLQPSAARNTQTDRPVFPTITSGQPARTTRRPSVVLVSATGNNSTAVTPPVLLQRSPSGNTGGTSGPSSSGSSSDDQPAAGPSSQMDDIYTSIGQNLQTPEGEKYNSVFAREFSLKNSRGVRECLEHGSKDPGPFDVVVQVSSNGAPQQALIFPDTGATGCLRSTLARASFSAPPAPGYWVKVTLTNNR